ncbi:MAG: methyltransferase domain-containing protein, partial [Anaerolineae bacterium]|nr:methyltransferase domain-containing protein [Anaerolineae bacterium]
RWTRAVRNQLYRRVNLLRAERVLDVGCGTGVITEEMAARCKGQVIGVDVDAAMVEFAQDRDDQAEYRVGDAHQLDFPDGHFDVVACHFLLMWVSNPALAVREMARVTRPGGAVLACAEPDYGGRIDYPEELPLARWQAEALRREGADPFTGRKLPALFAQAGLSANVGVIPSLWDHQALRAEFEAEWALMERTLVGIVSEDELRRYKQADWQAIEDGQRLIFMPIFYAVGRKTNDG